jgi:hypothetical protein
MRIELMTSSLPRKCSTTELQRHILLSEKRDSNPPPTAWKAVALPDELLPRLQKKRALHSIFFWWEEVDSNHRRLSQQIYSLPHLTALVSSPINLFLKKEPMDGLEPPTG